MGVKGEGGLGPVFPRVFGDLFSSNASSQVSWPERQKALGRPLSPSDSSLTF